MNISYSYDNDSRVTAINYNFGANALGNLTYSYDSLGRRIGVGGSFASTGFPSPAASAIYDGANELTNWNGTAISYDLNGNMMSDGTNTFSWNARNELASLNGRNLQYDAWGRRIQNSLGTAFLYDGANVAQERSGGAATANLLSGGIDEIFSRADSSGALTLLEDGLGSTLALVDNTGSIRTSYTYDPFGATSISGQSSASVFEYTGREDEENSLYFYRARYYSPVLGRFISEDPIGFWGGLNKYAYALGDPTNFVDPSGNEAGYYYSPDGHMYGPFNGGPEHTLDPSYYVIGLSIGSYSPSIQYVPSSGTLYITPFAGGVPSGFGAYANAGFILNPSVDPDQYVSGWGTSVCYHNIAGGCATFSDVNGRIEPAEEFGAGFGVKDGTRTPNSGANGGYTFTWKDIVWAWKGFAGRNCHAFSKGKIGY